MPSFFEKLKKGMNADASSLDLKIDDEKKGNLPTQEKPKKKTAPKVHKAVAPTKEPAVEETKPMLKAKTEEKQAVKTKIEIKAEEKKKVKEAPEEISPLDAAPPQKDSWFETEGQLVVDVYETNGEIVIQSAIAGVKPEEIDVDIEKDIVTIKGDRRKAVEKEGKNYFYQECYWGKFSREIILPAEVDGSRAQASMKDGVLTIRIPKIEREKKRKIAIK